MIKLFLVLLWHIKNAPFLICITCRQGNSQTVIRCGNAILNRASGKHTRPLDDTIAETVARAYVIRAEEKTGSDFLSDYRKAIPLLLRTFKWQAKEKNARQVSTLSQLACCYFRLAEHEKAAEALTELCHTSRNKKDVLQKLLRLNEQAKETKDIQFVADSLIKDLIFNWSATGSKKRISQ